MPLLPADEPERSDVLEQLIKQILKRRRIARSDRGQPLSGIYLEIYEVLQAAVRNKLLAYTKSVDVLTSDVSHEILTSCYPKVLTHERITALAIALQNTSPKTAERGYALDQLFAAIYDSKKLTPAHTLGVKERFYDDIVQEIIMEWGIRRIKDFKPEKAAFMTWINRQLKWKKSEVMGQLSSVNEISADFMLDGSNDTFNQRASPPLGEFLRECTDTCDHGDCQSVFEKHMRNRPEVTFRAVFNERYLLGKTWREISIRFGVKNLASLEHFLKRNLPKIFPCLHECVDDKVSLWNSQH